MAHGGSDKSVSLKANERRFAKSVTRIDNRPVSVRRIRCSTPDCGFESELIDQTASGMMSSMVEKKFEHKGWQVGKREEDDLCPRCVEAATVARRARRNANRRSEAINIKLVTTEGETIVQQPEVSTAVVDLPPQMGREDRRIVFAKLQDVYLDEKRGYQSPWTDKAVALEIGAPVAWVVAVRDEMFGPARDNQEIRELLDRSTASVAEARAFVDDAKKIRADGADLVARINELNGRAVQIGKNLDGLLTMAERIQKAVMP